MVAFLAVYECHAHQTILLKTLLKEELKLLFLFQKVFEQHQQQQKQQQQQK